jgi:hypothetical protein
VSTPYSIENEDFTNKAHAAAERLIYPGVFGVPWERMKFVNVTKTGWDLDHGVDYIVQIACGRRLPIEFTVQERFRRPDKASFQDLTITEWNPVTNESSELYKLKAFYMLYGYFDPGASRFIDAVCVNVPDLLLAITSGVVGTGRNSNPRSKQTFVSISFSEMERVGVLRWQQSASPTRGTYR